MRGLKRQERKASLALGGLVFLLLFLSGCKSAPTQDWSYKGIPQSGGDELSARIEFIEKRLKTRPKAFLDMAELAGLYLQRGKSRRQETDLAKATEWAERSLTEFENPSALLVKADYLQMRHEFADAWAIVEQVFTKNPTNLEAVVVGVRIRLSQGKAAEAKELASKLPGNSPLSSLIFLRAQVAEANGEVEVARQLYQNSIERETDGASPSQAAQRRGVLARMEIREGRWDEAWALLEAAHQIPVAQPLTEVLRAQVLAHREEYGEAEALLRAGYEQYRDAVFLVRLGEVERKASKEEAALKTFETAAELLKRDNLGHERDLALALHHLDAKANAAKIEELMKAELARRHDIETLRIRDIVAPGLEVEIVESAPVETATPNPTTSP